MWVNNVCGSSYLTRRLEHSLGDCINKKGGANDKMILLMETTAQQRGSWEECEISLYPHSNIISVNVKLMSPKYPALPDLTFSEPYLMSENTRPRMHQRTIPHRNEQSEFFLFLSFFFSSPCGEIYLYNCHLTLSQTHTNTHTETQAGLYLHWSPSGAALYSAYP